MHGYSPSSSLQVVGNSLKSLEVSEEKANQRVEEFKKQLKTLTGKLKEAEARAEYAEKTVKKLQKEVDRLEGKDFVEAVTISIKLYIFEQNYLQTVKVNEPTLRLIISNRR